MVTHNSPQAQRNSQIRGFATAANCCGAASRCCDWQSHQIVTIFHLSSGAVHDYYYISTKIINSEIRELSCRADALQNIPS